MSAAPAMKELIFNTTRALICRPGASRQLGNILKKQGCRKAFLITDSGVRGLGLLDGAVASLKEEGVGATVFDEVRADPYVGDVIDAALAARGMGADHIVGFGGGSPMDVAKLVACLAEPSNIQVVSEMYGVNAVAGPRLPLTLLPTTAGSGSEATSISIVTASAAGDEPIKKGVVSPQLLPDLAILDAELTLGLPPHVTADTGMDAMVHCIEAFTSRVRKNAISDALAKSALNILSSNIRTVVCTDPRDVEARSRMLLGAYMAGMAFNNSPVGAVHALAYPLGTLFGITHGLSNSLVLPHVLDFNREDPRAAALYAELLPYFNGVIEPLREAFDDTDSASELARELQHLQRDLGMRTRLSDMGITLDDIPLLVREASKQTRLLPNNVRDLGHDDIRNIYLEAL